jgi:L-asparagine transporter-like permease
MAVFSFLGIEIVAATAGEAAKPRVAVPKALRRTLFFLVLFYLGGLTLVVGLVPWRQIGLGESPFVRVFQTVGIPAAGHVMNFVILTAALSSAMCNLYFTARLLFSLARGGYAPAVLGRLNKRGMPVAAVLASSLGMAVAVILSHYFEATAFVFIWIMILLTHLAFRRANARMGNKVLRFAPAGPWSSLFGLGALLGVLISTWWVPGFRVTLKAGPPWLAFITVCYFVWRKAHSRKTQSGELLDG